jgi:hypothetical protein
LKISLATEDLFGHQDDFLQNLNGSRAPSPANILWTSNTTTSDSVSNAATAAANAVAASKNTNSQAASPAVQTTIIPPPYDNTIENRGLKTAGDGDIRDRIW